MVERNGYLVWKAFDLVAQMLEIVGTDAKRKSYQKWGIGGPYHPARAARREYIANEPRLWSPRMPEFSVEI